MINKNNGGINHDSLLDLTSLVDFCLKNGSVDIQNFNWFRLCYQPNKININVQ
jgi:hypothetical protein